MDKVNGTAKHGLTSDPWKPECRCGEKFANVTELDAHVNQGRVLPYHTAPQHDISYTTEPDHRNIKNY